MKTLWERRLARGECGKSAAGGIVLGIALAISAIVLALAGRS